MGETKYIYMKRERKAWWRENSSVCALSPTKEYISMYIWIFGDMVELLN